MDKTQPARICDECSARHRGICGALDQAQLDRLKKRARRHKVDPGDALIEPQETSGQLSVILTGAVKLTKSLPDGRQQIVGMQYAPDFLGRPYLKESDVTAEAVTETTLCSFPRHEIERMMSESPALEHRLYLQAMAELEEAREMLLTLGRRTARERVAAFLLFVSRHGVQLQDAKDASQPVSMLLARSEIADFLGLTLETVSRQLHKLKSMGIVRLEHKRGIVVLDHSRLRAAAGEVSGPDDPTDPERAQTNPTAG